MAKPKGERSEAIRVNKEFKAWLDQMHKQFKEAGMSNDLPQTTKIIAKKMRRKGQLKGIDIRFEFENERKKKKKDQNFSI